MNSKEIKPVNPKRILPPILHWKDWCWSSNTFWPSDVKSWLNGKDPDAGKDWGQVEKRATEDETVRRHHWLNGPEFEQAPADSEGQGSLASYSPWGSQRAGQDWGTEQQAKHYIKRRNFQKIKTQNWVISCQQQTW